MFRGSGGVNVEQHCYSCSPAAIRIHSQRRTRPSLPDAEVSAVVSPDMDCSDDERDLLLRGRFELTKVCMEQPVVRVTAE